MTQIGGFEHINQPQAFESVRVEIPVFKKDDIGSLGKNQATKAGFRRRVPHACRPSGRSSGHPKQCPFEGLSGSTARKSDYFGAVDVVTSTPTNGKQHPGILLSLIPAVPGSGYLRAALQQRTVLSRTTFSPIAAAYIHHHSSVSNAHDR